MDDTLLTVSRFESNLLTILRFLLGQPGRGDAVRLIGEKIPRPACLSPQCIHLIKDSLKKGCVLFLVKNGGWRSERILRNAALATGRVWEHTPLDERALSFGPEVVEFLIWLTAEQPTRPLEPWKGQGGKRSAADDLFFTMMLAAVEGERDIVNALKNMPLLTQNGLARLAFPSVFSNDAPLPDFDDWFQPPRVAILASLQAWLTSHWLALERGKGQVDDWTALGQQGLREAAVLSAYLESASRAGRPDLGRFLLHAASGAFADSDRTAEFWLGGLEGNGPNRMADRLAVRRAALAVPRAVGTLASWTQRYRSVGYFDETYAEAQLWKDEWERENGDVLAARARRVVESVEPLRADA
ncbi:MAG: hypothetical protein U0798_10975 [Gemmataceae bacterium]